MAPKTGRPKSNLRAAHRELTRELLVRAAHQEFVSHGYVDATVDAIIEGAGTSRGTFYLYFESKARILVATLDQYLEEYSEVEAQFTQASGDGTLSMAVLDELFRDFLLLTAKHKGLLRAWHQADAIEPSVYEVTKARTASAVDLWLRLHIPDPAEAEEELRLRTLLFSAMVERSLYLWVMGYVEIPLETFAHALAEAAMSTMRGPAKT